MKKDSVMEVFGLIALLCLGFGFCSLAFGGGLSLFTEDISRNYIGRGVVSVWIGLALFLIAFVVARLKKR